MIWVIQKTWLFLAVYSLSLGVQASLLISLFEHHQNNYFQQTAQGEIDFHDYSDTSIFLHPVPPGILVQPPECDEGQIFSWDPWDEEPAEGAGAEESQERPIPQIRLHRTGQPVIDLFFLASIFRGGQTVRTVRTNNRGSFSLIDGHWINESRDWDFVSPLLEYRLNGRNHTPLSRLIRQLLTGTSVTELSDHDLYDDLFFSPYDSRIWICIITRDGTRKVVIRIIRGSSLDFMAIITLPARAISPSPPRSRRGSFDQFMSKFSHPFGRRRSSQGNIPHQLSKSRKSSSNLQGSPTGSPKQTSGHLLNVTEVLAGVDSFTAFLAFLIIYAFQP